MVGDDGNQNFGRYLLGLRKGRLRITQGGFARRFGLTRGTIRNCEQERHEPSPAMRVLVAAIDMDPDFMAKAARAARERWG